MKGRSIIPFSKKAKRQTRNAPIHVHGHVDGIDSRMDNIDNEGFSLHSCLITHDSYVVILIVNS